MHLYRVSYTTEGGSSAGYGWYTTQKDATRAASEYVQKNPEEHRPVITRVPVPLTKAGVLTLVQQYASEPQNG